jgi:hypothetical protein
MLTGALNLEDTCVEELMTPIEHVYVPYPLRIPYFPLPLPYTHTSTCSPPIAAAAQNRH